MKQIFENEYLIFNHDEEKSIFLFIWKSESENLTKEKFVKEAQMILEIGLKLKCKYIIENNTNFKFPMSPDLQEEMNKSILTNLNGSIITKLAHVISKDFISQLSSEQFYDENINKTYEDKFFETLEEAKEWIYNE